MDSSCKLIFAATAFAVSAGVFASSLQAQQADFATTVIATHPIAYYRLDSTSGKSQTGISTYSSMGGVGIGLRGAGIAGSSNKFIRLDGQSGYLLTTQK